MSDNPLGDLERASAMAEGQANELHQLAERLEPLCDALDHACTLAHWHRRLAPLYVVGAIALVWRGIGDLADGRLHVVALLISTVLFWTTAALATFAIAVTRETRDWRPSLWRRLRGWVSGFSGHQAPSCRCCGWSFTHVEAHRTFYAESDDCYVEALCGFCWERLGSPRARAIFYGQALRTLSEEDHRSPEVLDRVTAAVARVVAAGG